MNESLRTQILEELLRRLGDEERFVQVAERAGVPNIVMPGASLARRYEQLVDRLWQNGPAALAGYLEAAAQVAGGGFEVRYSLSRPSSGGWDISELRTAMIMLPKELDPSLEATSIVPALPGGAASPPVEPAPAPAEPAIVPELDTLEKNRAKRDIRPPPVGDLDKSVEIPSLTLQIQDQLKQLGQAIDLRLGQGGGGLALEGGPLKLREAHLVVNAGGDGTRGVLHLIGEGLRRPLFIEIDGWRGSRIVERVRPQEAHVALTERDRHELLNRRVRVVSGADASPWCSIQPGGRDHEGEPLPVFRRETAYVPAGEYYLPGEGQARRLEQGVHLSLVPVTNQEFLSFVQRTGYVPEKPEGFLKHHRPDSFPKELLEHPVIFVNHSDAMAYCQWAGGMLPTAEMWERAAVGLQSRVYPWGDTFDLRRLNSRESRHGWTTPVRQFTESRGPYGHFDLAGNVWEWTSSPADDDNHVYLKGGSWVNDKRCAANTFRAIHRKELRAFYIGFRVAFPLPPGLEGA